MSYIDPSAEDYVEARRGNSFPKTLLLLIVTVLCVTIVFYAFSPKRGPFTNPKIKADPYVWPQGCEKKNYSESDDIDKACMSPSYFIGEGNQWGWPRDGKGYPEYYRVGNDAIDIRYCDEDEQNKCHVRNMVRDVYAVSGDPK